MISLKKMFVSGYILVSLSTASFAYAQETGTTMGSSLNVRKEASTKSSVIFQLPKNKSVKILDKKAGWYKISYDNKTGWVSDDFVKLSKTTEKTTAKASDKSVKESSNIAETKVIANNVNIRSKASTNSSVVTQAKLNQKVTIISTEKDWTNIKINGKSGWISTKYLEKKTSKTAKSAEDTEKVQPIAGVINGNDVNVRKTPSTSASVIAQIDDGKPVKILTVDKEWTKVSTVATTGWVASKYVSKSVKTTSRSDNTIRDTRSLEYNDDLASKIIETAKDYLGTNYVYGGTTPRGFDCSGYIGYIMEKHGINLPRTSAEQGTVGEHVNRDDLKPGDLVFFDTDGGKNHISHVGMYIGNGNFIHASSGGDGEVRISSLSEHFYSVTYMTARRVIK